MNVTPKEVLVLRAIVASEYQTEVGRGRIDFPVWSDCLWPGQSGGILETVTAAQLPGVVSSLNQKKLVHSQPSDDTIEITAAGYAILESRGLV